MKETFKAGNVSARSVPKMKRFLAFAAALHVGFFVIPAVLVFFGEWIAMLPTGGALPLVAVVIVLGVALAVKVYLWLSAKLEVPK